MIIQKLCFLKGKICFKRYLLTAFHIIYFDTAFCLILACRKNKRKIGLIVENTFDLLVGLFLRSFFWLCASGKCINTLIGKCKYMVRSNICQFWNHRICIRVTCNDMIYFVFTYCAKIIKTYGGFYASIMNIHTGNCQFLTICRQRNC